MPTSERLKTVIFTRFTDTGGVVKGSLELKTNKGLYSDEGEDIRSLRNNAVLLSRKHDVPLVIIDGDLIRKVLTKRNQPPKP